VNRKALLVLSSLFETRGGIPRFNQMLCLALDRIGPAADLDVTVLSQDDRLDHYRVHGAPWRHARFVPGGGRVGLIHRALWHCVRERPDLMLVGLLGMAPLGALCRPWLRRGFGFVAHGAESWAEPRATRRWAARRARFIFAVSQDTGRALVRATGARAADVRLLPNTLDPSFEVPTADEPTAERGLELLTVARLWAEERMKGVDHTLEAFARLAGRYPEARYRIVGKGSDKPRLQQLARSLGLADRVRFEEDVPDERLAGYYRDCAVFVMPSGQEGFGIVFLEAMRFAKPCIGGNAGGTPEVVVDGETGVLVPFGDVPALTRALDRLLGDPALRATLGRAGRRRLVEQFLFDRFEQRLAGYLDAWLAS
jgi:glycosyltransferase involved in cell wall biosynthesis